MEPQAAQPHLQSPVQKTEQRAHGRFGELHAHRLEHRADDAIALVQMSAAQELLGRAALELQPHRRRRAGRRFEIHLRRVVPASACRQRVAALRLNLAAHRGLEGRELERRLIELRRAIERQRVARAIGGAYRVRRSALVLARAAEMFDERFGIDVALALEHERQLRVHGAQIDRRTAP